VSLSTGHVCISSSHSKCRVNSPGVGCGDSQNKGPHDAAECCLIAAMPSSPVCIFEHKEQPHILL